MIYLIEISDAIFYLNFVGRNQSGGKRRRCDEDLSQFSQAVPKMGLAGLVEGKPQVIDRHEGGAGEPCSQAVPFGEAERRDGRLFLPFARIRFGRFHLHFLGFRSSDPKGKVVSVRANGRHPQFPVSFAALFKLLKIVVRRRWMVAEEVLLAQREAAASNGKRGL